MIEYKDSHLRFFETIAPQKAAEIIYKLRHGEWPEELPDKPEEWGSMSEEDALKWSEIVDFYAAEVGEKAVLRYQLKAEFGLSDEEINDKWEFLIDERLKTLQDSIEDIEYQRYGGYNQSNYRYTNTDIRTYIALALSILSIFLAIASFFL